MPNPYVAPATVARPHAPLANYVARRQQPDHDRLEKEISQGLSKMWESITTSRGGNESSSDVTSGARLSSPRAANVQFLNIDGNDKYEFGGKKKMGKTSVSQVGASAQSTAAPFSIPESPRGRQLTINILSTWGDRHYLGLNGIEIYDNRGQLCEVASISADPADINVLPENAGANDPRTVGNLVDGVNFSCDDSHAWLCPFTSGTSHWIFVDLARPTPLSMIRVWK